MGKRRKYRRYRSRSRKMTEEDKFQWIFVVIVFIVLFVIFLIYNFASNCIFEWPIRWDIATCWVEQIDPSKMKAIEEAIQFAP